MNLFVEQEQTHRLWLPKETGCVGGSGLGVWDGNVLKLACDDGCTTTNIIKFIEFLKNYASTYLEQVDLSIKICTCLPKN